MFKLAPASVVLIELLLACRYVKHAGWEEWGALGGEGIRSAYGWIGGIDITANGGEEITEAGCYYADDEDKLCLPTNVEPRKRIRVEPAPAS